MDFNKFAHNWDTDRRIQRAKTISNFIMSKCKIDKNYILLEYGCGTGLISSHFVNHVSKIIGYDTSDTMLEVFNTKFQEFNDRVSSTSNLVLFENSIDIVLSSMVFHHIMDIDLSFKEIHKVLRKNGYVFIIDLDQDDGSFHKDELDFSGHNGFNREFFMEQLHNEGFRIIDFGDVLQDVKVVDKQMVEYSLFFVYAQKV